MSDRQGIHDAVQIAARRGEFSDAEMMRDFERFASLFTPDGTWRMPHINVELAGGEEIRAAIERLRAGWDYDVQHQYLGTVHHEGDAPIGPT
jgi:ketosteroid isomerase-like protein